MGTILLLILVSVLTGALFSGAILFIVFKRSLTKEEWLVAGATFILLLSIFGVIKVTNQVYNKDKKVEIPIVYESLDKTKLLLEAIREVESGGDTLAINPESGAAGDLQILPIVVKEASIITGKKYSNKDRFSKEESEEMFHAIQSKYNPKGDIEKAIRIWYGGPSYTKANTQEYYDKVIRAYNNKKDEALHRVVKQVNSLSLY